MRDFSRCSEWFGLFIRCVGFLLVVYAVWTAEVGVGYAVGAYGYSDTSPGACFFAAMIKAIIGVCLIWGAPVIADAAYPRTNKSPDYPSGSGHEAPSTKTSAEIS